MIDKDHASVRFTVDGERPKQWRDGTDVACDQGESLALGFRQDYTVVALKESAALPRLETCDGVRSEVPSEVQGVLLNEELVEQKAKHRRVLRQIGHVDVDHTDIGEQCA